MMRMLTRMISVIILNSSAHQDAYPPPPSQPSHPHPHPFSSSSLTHSLTHSHWHHDLPWIWVELTILARLAMGSSSSETAEASKIKEWNKEKRRYIMRWIIEKKLENQQVQKVYLRQENTKIYKIKRGNAKVWARSMFWSKVRGNVRVGVRARLIGIRYICRK